MAVISSFQRGIQYVAEAVMVIFNPSTQDLPPIGVQPFRGDLDGLFDDWLLAPACPLSCLIDRP